MADHSQNRTFGRAPRRIIAAIVAFCGFFLVFVWRLLPSHASSSAAAPVAARAGQAAQYGPDHPETGFERSDWPLWPVALIYISVILLLVISCLVLKLAYPNSLADVGRNLRIAPSGPRLQTDAAGNLQRFRADEKKKLDSYYWIDKQKGAVHIPIEQAMKKLVATGIPGFPKAQQ